MEVGFFGDFFPVFKREFLLEFYAGVIRLVINRVIH